MAGFLLNLTRIWSEFRQTFGPVLQPRGEETAATGDFVSAAIPPHFGFSA
jgi:hypothetical protein